MTNVWVVTADEEEWSRPLEVWTNGRQARKRAEQLRRDLLARREADKAKGGMVPLDYPSMGVETYSVRRAPLREGV